MSFAEFRSIIKEGDTVILYMNPFQIYALEVKPQILNKKGMLIEHIFQTQYGGLKVIELVGQKFGSKIYLSKGYGYVLLPTPELWTLTLPHRTQILYTPDISLIITELDVIPGSIVCEAGTGSGSLSHAFLRAVGPGGKLYSCDFHQDRVDAAQKEFNNHGLGNRVILEKRDVCTEGWQDGIEADAVFLDLPKPWEALMNAVKAIKPSGGRVCSFSPCIEQVKKTCELMKNIGLTEINTRECLQREFQMKNIAIQPVSVKKIPVSEMKHIHKPEQIDHKKMKTEVPEDYGQDATENNVSTNVTSDSKEITTDTTENISQDRAETNSNASTDTNIEVKTIENNNDVKEKNSCANGSHNAKEIESSFKFKSAVPLLKIPGHTGYLTFATVPPFLPR